MKIKKGDKVKILKGKDSGKTGKVLQVFPQRKKASIEGRNLLIKHMRPRKQGEKGQRIEFPAPMDLSNVILICPKCSQPARINYQYLEIARNVVSENTEAKRKKKKVRSCNKCKQIID